MGNEGLYCLLQLQPMMNYVLTFAEQTWLSLDLLNFQKIWVV